MPEMLAASFPTHGHRKPILHTFVPYYKQQNQLFPPAPFLETSEGDRKKLAATVQKHLDYIYFSVLTARRSSAMS